MCASPPRSPLPPSAPSSDLWKMRSTEKSGRRAMPELLTCQRPGTETKRTHSTENACTFHVKTLSLSVYVWGEHVLYRTHSIENTFYWECLYLSMRRTHSTENVFIYLSVRRRRSVENTFYREHVLMRISLSIYLWVSVSACFISSIRFSFIAG